MATLPKTSWRETTVQLYLADGSVASVPAQRGIYEFEMAGTKLGIPAIVFQAPDNSGAWGQREMDFYVSLDNQIVGVRQQGSGTWELRRSSFPEDVRKSLPLLADTFTNQSLYVHISEAPADVIDLRDAVRWDFFTLAPGSSAGGMAEVTEVQFHDNELRLDLKSPHGEYRARVWIDLKKNAVLRVEESSAKRPR